MDAISVEVWILLNYREWFSTLRKLRTAFYRVVRIANRIQRSTTRRRTKGPHHQSSSLAQPDPLPSLHFIW